MDWFATTFLLLGLVALAPFVLGPLLVRSRFRFSSEPVLEPIDPSELPDDGLRYMDERVRELADLGFEEDGWLTLRGFVPDAIMHFAIMNDPARLTGAAIVTGYAQVGDVRRINSMHVELCTRLVGDRELCTNNSGELTVGGQPEGKVVHHFPDVPRVADLLDVHLALLDRGPEQRSARRELPRGDEVAGYILDGLHKYIDHLERHGFIHGEGEGIYRPTWKGACLMTWGLMWPLTILRRAARTRRMARLRESL